MINLPHIDDLTIISCAVLLVIVIVSSLISPFLRFKKRKWEERERDVADPLPTLSIILTPHDEAEALEKNLSSLMGQKYPSGFQVIVVIEKGENETEEVLQRFQKTLEGQAVDGSLYFTYIPETSRYVSRKKLAMTLGVKAARTEWLLFTEPTSRPASDTWLQTMAEDCVDANSLVMGYGCYAGGVSSFKRFERLCFSYYLMREAARGTAYATVSPNIMIRKTEFMKQEGFRGNLHLIHGEYDFLINKYAVKGRVALETRNEAWIIDDAPSHREWMAQHVVYQETRKWLKRSFSHRLWFNLDQIALHFPLLLIIVAIFWGALTTNLIVLAVSGVSLITLYLIHTLIGCKAISTFQEQVPTMLIYPYQLLMIWRKLFYWLRYKASDKLDFTTHKL